MISRYLAGEQKISLAKYLHVIRVRTVHSLKVFQLLFDVNCHPVLSQQIICNYSAATNRVSSKI